MMRTRTRGSTRRKEQEEKKKEGRKKKVKDINMSMKIRHYIL